MKNLDLGVTYGEDKCCILLFADDIVILAETEEELQKLLKFVENWCMKWRLRINKDKTKVIHFRKKELQKLNIVSILIIMR